MTSITATPAKLNNGSWGARTAGTVRVGDTVTITTKAGKSWDARVTAVIWTGNGVSLVATASQDRAPSSSYRSSAPSRGFRRRNEDEECEMCGKNMYTCGHCIGW